MSERVTRLTLEFTIESTDAEAAYDAAHRLRETASLIEKRKPRNVAISDSLSDITEDTNGK